MLCLQQLYNDAWLSCRPVCRVIDLKIIPKFVSQMNAIKQFATWPSHFFLAALFLLSAAQQSLACKSALLLSLNASANL
jgi:hypothetical protein